MDKEYKDMMQLELKSINLQLSAIAQSLKKFVDEGITIYTHEDGPEARN